MKNNLQPQLHPPLLKRLFSKTFYGWWVLAACIGMQIVNTGLLMQAYGTYTAVLQDTFPWSKTIYATGFSVQYAVSGFLAPLVGNLLLRFGPRKIMTIGVIILGLGFIAFSFINSVWSFLLVLSIMSFGSALSGFLAVNTLAFNWFDHWRSTSIALLQTGMSIGGLVVPAIAYALVTLGWRPTAILSGGLILFFGLIFTFVIRNFPEDIGSIPDGKIHSKQVTNKHQVQSSYNFTAKEALQTSSFWFLSFGHALAMVLIFALMAHLVPFLKEERGLSVQFASNIFALLTGITIAGQLLGGYLGTKVNQRLLIVACMFAHAISILLLAFGTSLFWVYCFAVLHGLAWGIRAPMMQLMRADYFGRKNFAQIMGNSAVIVTMGIILGPMLAGVMTDIFGSYRNSFVVLAILAAIGSVFFVLAVPPKPPKVSQSN